MNNDMTPSVNGELWIISQLRNPKVLLDIGFHRGIWSRKASNEFPSATIHAFDPWHRAQVEFENAGFAKSVYFHPVAVSNVDARSTFFDYDSGRNSLLRQTSDQIVLQEEYGVEVVTLDSWCKRRKIDHVDYAKIDVQGAEMAVLEGADELLRSHAIEAFSFGYSTGWVASKRYLGEAYKYVIERGYQIFKLFPKFMVPFKYDPTWERSGEAMYVCLSPRAASSGAFRVRHFRLA